MFAFRPPVFPQNVVFQEKTASLSEPLIQTFRTFSCSFIFDVIFVHKILFLRSDSFVLSVAGLPSVACFMPFLESERSNVLNLKWWNMKLVHEVGAIKIHYKDIRC